MDILTPNDAQQHELPSAIADELTRMEQNLAHIDPATRGHKQLLRSVTRMKTHLQAAGYELPELMGHPYHDGMRVVATFVIDETMPPEQHLITAVTQPQVNFQGKMIQVAHVTVSQNL